MKSFYTFVQNNADRLFAGFCLVGSVLIAKAGNYADNNGDQHNIYLTASGVIELVAEVWLLLAGDRGRRISAPGFVLSGLGVLASGVGLFGLANGSVSEIASGIPWTAGAILIFYGDRLFPRMKLSGGMVGSWLYQISLVPLLIAGIQHGNPFEWGSAVSFAIANLAMSTKLKEIS
jgi:peptidoglycan/LPS O-acetylase OafA/YrhL